MLRARFAPWPKFHMRPYRFVRCGRFFIEPLRDKVSLSTAQPFSRICKKQRADRSGPPVALGFVSQENFAVLTATFAIPIEFQTKLEVRKRNRYNYFKENRYNQPMEENRMGSIYAQLVILSISAEGIEEYF